MSLPGCLKALALTLPYSFQKTSKKMRQTEDTQRKQLRGVLEYQREQTFRHQTEASSCKNASYPSMAAKVEAIRCIRGFGTC